MRPPRRSAYCRIPLTLALLGAIFCRTEARTQRNSATGWVAKMTWNSGRPNLTGQTGRRDKHRVGRGSTLPKVAVPTAVNEERSSVTSRALNAANDRNRRIFPVAPPSGEGPSPKALRTFRAPDGGGNPAPKRTCWRDSERRNRVEVVCRLTGGFPKKLRSPKHTIYREPSGC